MNAVILKCKPGSFFRIGEGSLNDVSHVIHSDTLFSALTNIYELVYGEGDNFIRLVNENKIAFSSAFPVLEEVREKKFIYFLPRPYITYSNSKLLGKKAKAIKFFSIHATEILLNDLNIATLESKTDLSLFDIIADQFCCLKDEIAVTNIPDAKRRFIKEIISPKTAVHKETKEDSFYFQTDIQLIPLSEKDKLIYIPHFYFFFNHSLSPEELAKFTACLRILGDEGIGGDRSAGKGKFEDVIFKEIQFKNYYQNNLFMNVSIFNPKDQSEFDKCVFYDLMRRGGGSLGIEGHEDHHRKQVRMIAEGSIIRGSVEGRLVDVSPFINLYQNKIYRNGKAFLIQIG